jgi:hypothetical protein
MRTLAVPTHTRFQVTTDANGNAASLVLPNWIYDNVVASTPVGTSAQYVGSMATATRLSGVSQYRIITMGVKVRAISAPLYRSGMVRVRGLPAGTGTDFDAIDMLSYRADYFEDVALADAQELAIVLKRRDKLCELYQTPIETTSTIYPAGWVSPGWGACQIAITGGPILTTVLEIEVFANYEVMFADSEQSTILAQPPPYYDHRVDAARKGASSQMKAVFKKGAEAAGKHVVKAAAVAAVDAVGGYLAGPVGMQAGNRLIKNAD